MKRCVFVHGGCVLSNDSLSPQGVPVLVDVVPPDELDGRAYGARFSPPHYQFSRLDDKRRRLRDESLLRLVTLFAKFKSSKKQPQISQIHPQTAQIEYFLGQDANGEAVFVPQMKKPIIVGNPMTDLGYNFAAALREAQNITPDGIATLLAESGFSLYGGCFLSDIDPRNASTPIRGLKGEFIINTYAVHKRSPERAEIAQGYIDFEDGSTRYVEEDEITLAVLHESAHGVEDMLFGFNNAANGAGNTEPHKVDIVRAYLQDIRGLQGSTKLSNGYDLRYYLSKEAGGSQACLWHGISEVFAQSVAQDVLVEPEMFLAFPRTYCAIQHILASLDVHVRRNPIGVIPMHDILTHTL